MIVLIDNYDSFTFNLVHYLGGLGANVLVHRNDKIAAGAVTLRKPPIAHSTTRRPMTRLAPKAATITSGRMVRSIERDPQGLKDRSNKKGRRRRRPL